MVVPYWKTSMLVLLASAAAACGSEGGQASKDVGTTENAFTGESEHDQGHGKNGDPVGLSFWFQDGAVRLENGSPKTVDIYGDFDRFVQELDITASVDTTTDQGITPVIHSGDMAGLDWSGVQQVDEDWRPELGSNPPTYTRSRFYRGAKWMERDSVLAITPVDDHNRPVGVPIIELAGSDNKWRDSDDGFIRRFDARQITHGCRAIHDCTGAAAFTAQGLMQVRDAMHADRRAQQIPDRATKLEVFWSEDARNARYIPIRHKKTNSSPYGYGFKIDVEELSHPANHKFYSRGDIIDYRITYRDAQGNRLNPPGSFPSYADFATDNIASGIRYYDGFTQFLTLYYALKHREGNTIWSFSGPSNKLKYTGRLLTNEVFLTQSGGTGMTTATVAESGFSGSFDILPTVAGTLDPVLSTQPSSDTLHVKVPDDALPGTYTFAFKGRRDWGGEALNETGLAEVQVGTKTESDFKPTTGNCQGCHKDESGFDKVLHRNADRRTCYGCHVPLEQEPDHALDYRIHLIHTRSNRVPADPNNCSMCHLTKPTGVPRGFPGHTDL